MAKAPCMKCTERHTNCHSHCEKYLEFTERLQKEKDQDKILSYSGRWSRRSIIEEQKHK